MKLANTIGKIFVPEKVKCTKCDKEYVPNGTILFHGKDYCSYECFINRNDNIE